MDGHKSTDIKYNTIIKTWAGDVHSGRALLSSIHEGFSLILSTAKKKKRPI
jgi:hypothetical protein